MNKTVKKIVIINFILLSMLIGLNAKTTLLINKSDSLEGKILLLVKAHTFMKGDLVGIKDFDTIYTGVKHFTKKVVGLPGEQIQVKGKAIYINGKFQALAKNKTKDGRVLTPIKEQVIQKDHYFVINEHKDSFDSRYQEFGLVGEENIEGKAYLLW